MQTIKGRRFALITMGVVLLGAVRLVGEEPLPQEERLKSSPVLRHLKPNPTAANPGTEAERTVARMFVPEGFKVEVVAAEPDVRQPIAFAWDERGRIWVAEAFSYPTKRPEGEGLDRIIILADGDGDGRFESRKIFAEKLNLVSGLEVGHGGVWIGAAPELLFIPDADADDKPDGPPQILLDGFGYQDTHETLNSFLWGPDGWLYGIQGVFNTARIGKPGVPAEERPELRAGVWRYHPVRHIFEIFAHGGSNPWGLDYDEHGQLFMTHCRSFWGRGLTTHVMQGGQFWNQVNANYASFIIPNPPKEFPEFRNYLLASARYDHGAGGAGPRGSDAIYGGHSHVGTMIYLGDNWPEEYRGRLFTHNLGGHQINQQLNKPLGSGFDTVHAGQDVLFCTDPKYVAVDLQYGPDGAVYFIDWYDQQHCHNPNTERWDRGNGRIYRMEWEATYKPAKVDLRAKSDSDLVELLRHRNAWFGRTAQRLLHERATKKGVDGTAVTRLAEMRKSPEPALQLKALWTTHLIKGAPDAAFSDRKFTNDYVRAWGIQLLTEQPELPEAIGKELLRMAREDRSPVVRRYLASALSRIKAPLGWELATELSKRTEDENDRNIPYLLWHGLAPLVKGDVDRALTLAEQSRLPQLREWIYSYAGTLEGLGPDRAVASLRGLKDIDLHRRLAGLWLAVEPRANVPMPAGWKSVAPNLYAATNIDVRRLGEKIAASFGDDTAFPRLRTALAERETSTAERRHAFAVLSRAQDRSSMSTFIALLDDPAFRSAVIPLLGRFESPEVAPALLQRYGALSPNDRAAVLNAMTSRPSFALALLDAVAAKQIARDQITSFQIRQLAGLKNSEVDKRVTALWGRIAQTPVEKQNQIARLEKIFNEAPLWAYNGNAGKAHFQTLCASCHKLGDQGTRLGPELTGAGKHGVRYYLENIIDPDAVIGTDFQLTTVTMKDEETLSGLLVNETASGLTLRTTTGEIVVPKKDIKSHLTSEKSMMPEGLLESLGAREQIELLKFLTTN